MITIHYITLHYMTLHYITLHYITLHYIHTSSLASLVSCTHSQHSKRLRSWRKPSRFSLDRTWSLGFAFRLDSWRGSPDPKIHPSVEHCWAHNICRRTREQFQFQEVKHHHSDTLTHSNLILFVSSFELTGRSFPQDKDNASVKEVQL